MSTVLRLALVVSLIAATMAPAAPLVTEASVGLDSQPKPADSSLQPFASTVSLGAHQSLTAHLSLGADVAWSRHDAPHILSDCFDCFFPQRADFVRAGPSARWTWALDGVELYLQAGPQLSVVLLHTTGGFTGSGRDQVSTGFTAAVRAGALVELNASLAVGASIEGYFGTAQLGGVGGSGSMIIALRL